MRKGHKHTDESKAKMRASWAAMTPEKRALKSERIKASWTPEKRARESVRRRASWTEERRAAFGAIRKGMTHKIDPNNKPGNKLGTKFSDEWKKRMSVASKGKPKSEAHKAAISAAQIKRIANGGNIGSNLGMKYKKSQKQIEKEAK